jgi:cell division transport system ATP-binding protein
MITFSHVSKRHGDHVTLDHVSWKMEEGECVVFCGPSGAGKTSILRLITHEILPSSGTVTVGTFRGGRLRRAQRALLRRTLGIIYEDFRLLNDRTVFENVALAVRIMGVFRPDEVIPRVLYALREVGLQDKQTSLPGELSNGEKQRAAIARAIVNRPAVILADEPTGALEKKSALEILGLLKSIHTEGAGLLLVTTREEVAEFFGGRVLTIEDGRITSGATMPAPSPADIAFREASGR